jgi:hypothetical protein
MGLLVLSGQCEESTQKGPINNASTVRVGALVEWPLVAPLIRAENAQCWATRGQDGPRRVAGGRTTG